MCGICGQYNFRNQAPVDPGAIRRMTGTLVHRGPDDEGYFVSGPLGLGFRRLSIIDLEGGHQPMADNDETVWIVFNGEIYNFPELKRELEDNGHVFKTKCDTEVIIYGYKQWGEDVFDHLNGMFGLAIWDARKKKLIISRDAMGIKLVYYKIEAGSVFFGSEIRAINVAPNRTKEVDPLSLNLFLRYRYTPSPLTLYNGIRKLAPGTMIVFENGEVREKRWYRFKPQTHLSGRSPDEAQEELLSIYKRAVNRHLLSDVPVGLLLSGGVDSGLLLGLMGLRGNDWPTYTVGYGKSFKDDELIDAARTAHIFSSKNIQVELDKETFERNLSEIIGFLEEPVATSSIVPMYFVSQRARRDVKVALVGQGPDELFGGYRRHLGIRYGKYWRSLPNWLTNSINVAVNRLPRNETLKRGVYALGIEDRLKRYQATFSLIPQEKIDGLFIGGRLPDDAGDKVLELWSELSELMDETDELGGFQFLELRFSLPDELLMYADKMSMAHGLEIRVPYLDREVVEYVESLSPDYKVRCGVRKWLHKRVCTKFLPKEIIKRKKRGFAVNVVDDWFNASLSKKMGKYFMDPQSKMFAYLKHDAVNRLLEEHQSGRNDNHKILFSLVVFEEWLRKVGF